MRFMEEQKVVVLKLSRQNLNVRSGTIVQVLEVVTGTGVYDGMNCTQDIMYTLPEKLKSP